MYFIDFFELNFKFDCSDDDIGKKNKLAKVAAKHDTPASMRRHTRMT